MRASAWKAVAFCVAIAVVACAIPGVCAQQNAAQTNGQATVAANGKGQAANTTATPVSGKKRLAVINFDTPEEYWNTPLSRGLADMMITALVKSGSFDVIERTQLDAILKEHNLAAQGMIDPTTAVQAGKILGVDYILGGKVTEFGVKEKKSGIGALAGRVLGGVDIKNSTARVKMDVRLVDVTTARILLADTGLGEEKEKGIAFAAGGILNLVAVGRFDTQEWAESRIGKATRKAVDQVLGKITSFFPACGRVLGVMDLSGKRCAILDLGKFSGIEVGKEFKVHRESAIKDDSGAVIWSEKQDVGTVRVIEVQNERSKAEIVSESTPIQKGDTFEIPAAKPPEAGKEKPK